MAANSTKALYLVPVLRHYSHHEVQRPEQVRLQHGGGVAVQSGAQEAQRVQLQRLVLVRQALLHQGHQLAHVAIQAALILNNQDQSK